MGRPSADESTAPSSIAPRADTIRPTADRAAGRARLIEIIARQLVQQTIQERHENLPVRPVQH